MSRVAATLDDLQQRLRRAVAACGLTWSAAILGGGSGVVAAADAVWGINGPWFRFAGCALVCLAAAALLVQLVRRLRSPEWSRVRMALLLERLRPELRDQLAGAAELADRVIPSQRAALDALVLESAARKLAEVSPAAVIDRRPVWRAATALALVLTGWACWLIAAPPQAALALQRVLRPFTAPDWPRSVVLVLLDDRLQPLTGERRLCVADEPLTVYVENQRGGLPRDLRLESAADPDGPLPLTLTTVRDAQGRERRLAAAALTPEAGGLQLRARGGDDLTMPWQEFDVRPAPRLERFRVQVAAPEYLGLPVEDVERSSGHAAGWIGSQVTITATSNVPLAEAVLQIEGRPPESITLPDPTTLQLQFRINTEGRSTYGIDLRDEFGLGPARPQKYEIQGRRDHPPQVHWRGPGGAVTAVPNAVLPVSATAADDVGLSGVALVWTFEGRDAPAGRRPSSTVDPGTPPSVPRPTTQRAEWDWDLSMLQLPPGTRLEFAVEAVDSRTPDPQRSTAPPLQLTIVSAEDKRLELDELQAGLAATIDRLVDRHAALEVALQELHTQATVAGVLRESDREQLRRVDRERRRTGCDLSEEPSGVHAQAQHIRAQLAWNRLSDSATSSRMTRLQAHVRDLVEHELPEFGQRLAELQPPAAATGETADDADSAVDAASFDAAYAGVQSTHDRVRTTLQAMQADLQTWQRHAETTQVLEAALSGQREVLQQTEELGQETLSREVAALTPQQRAALATLSARQSRLAAAFAPLDATPDAGEVSSEPRLTPATIDSVVSRMTQAADDVAANRTAAAASLQRDIVATLESALQQLSDANPADRLQAIARLREEAERLRLHYRDWQERWRQRPLDPDQSSARELLRSDHSDLDSQLAELASGIGRANLPQSTRIAARAAAESRSLSSALAAQQDARVEALLPRVLAELQRLEEELSAEQAATSQAMLAAAIAGLSSELQPLHQAQLELISETQALEDRLRNAGRRSRSDLRQLAAAAELQQELAQQLGTLADRLQGSALLEAVLREATDHMHAAASGLRGRRSDAGVVADQRSAAARVGSVLTATDELPSATAPNAAPDAAGRTNATGDSLRVELSLLKSMQIELQVRTLALQKQLADQPDAPELQGEGERLAAEQERLAAQAAALWESQKAAGSTGTSTREPE